MIQYICGITAVQTYFWLDGFVLFCIVFILEICKFCRICPQRGSVTFAEVGDFV